MNIVEEEAAVRCLELLNRLTTFAIGELHGNEDRLAMRCALTLMLERTQHPADHFMAAKVTARIREGLLR